MTKDQKTVLQKGTTVAVPIGVALTLLILIAREAYWKPLVTDVAANTSEVKYIPLILQEQERQQIQLDRIEDKLDRLLMNGGQ